MSIQPCESLPLADLSVLVAAWHCMPPKVTAAWHREQSNQYLGSSCPQPALLCGCCSSLPASESPCVPNTPSACWVNHDVQHSLGVSPRQTAPAAIRDSRTGQRIIQRKLQPQSQVSQTQAELTEECTHLTEAPAHLSGFQCVCTTLALNHICVDTDFDGDA